MAISEHILRRGILKGAPVAPFAVGAFPALASTTRDPLPDLFAQMETAHSTWSVLSEREGTPEEKAAWSEFRRLEDLIEATVANSPEGVAAQIQYMKLSYGNGYTYPTLNVEANEVPLVFLGVILEGLGRIAR